MAERSRLRELIDAFVLSGRGKVEIDALLTDLERSAKAMGAYEAGRDHAPAIAQLVEAKVRLEARVVTMEAAILWALGEKPLADGRWFDERAFGHDPDVKRVAPYWWRSILRLYSGVDEARRG